jgi:hypothetical protein
MTALAAELVAGVVTPTELDGGIVHTGRAAELSLFAPTNLVYTMRGYDQTALKLVFWNTAEIDPTAAKYTGPGPVTGIIVHARRGL